MTSLPECAVPFTAMRYRWPRDIHRFLSTCTNGVRPEQWWVSEEPVQVAYAPADSAATTAVAG